MASHPPFLVYSLLGIVDFLHLFLRGFHHVVAECGDAVGVVLAHEVTLGAAHLVVCGSGGDAENFVGIGQCAAAE